MREMEALVLCLSFIVIAENCLGEILGFSQPLSLLVHRKKQIICTPRADVLYSVRKIDVNVAWTSLKFCSPFLSVSNLFFPSAG